MSGGGTLTTTGSPRIRQVARTAARALLVVLGGYLVLRALAEPFVIDPGNPASYRHDWGGPHLIGVLLVHCGPGVVAGLLAARWIRRRRPGIPDG